MVYNTDPQKCQLSKQWFNILPTYCHATTEGKDHGGISMINVISTFIRNTSWQRI